MDETVHLPLNAAQIAVLEKQGCRCDDWSRVFAAEGFDPRRVSETEFRGTIELGRLDGSLSGHDGIMRRCGIVRARLQDVCVRDGCVIDTVAGWLSNVIIEPRVLIENVGTIASIGETTFGNGHEIPVMIEAGGRELPITAETSSQIAFLTVLFRGRRKLVSRLQAMAAKTARLMNDRRMVIGTGAVIVGCGEIVNVQVGGNTRITGATRLREGTIVSSAEDPVTIGHGVIADRFIIQRGATVTDGAMISSSLIGEGVRLTRQFSCENSAFFANGDCALSEASSLLAGPCTVTHHRSTLLIAASVSFFNAGSGSNQSNHLYRLGPLHQGILERGCKTGSSSYMLWPSHIGPFSTVVKRHERHLDTSAFPFSLVTVDDGRSMLVPGITFFMAGILRDEDKWPARDRRPKTHPIDQISWNVLSPFTAGRMMEGKRRLQALAKTDCAGSIITVNGVAIKRGMLPTYAGYYQDALDIYFGNLLLDRLARNTAPSLTGFIKPSRDGEGKGEWVDIGGLLCPKSRIDRICGRIESGAIASHTQLLAEFEEIHACYADDEWNWFLLSYQEHCGKDLVEDPAVLITAQLERWRKATYRRLTMVLKNCGKEFEEKARIGYGSGGEDPRDDFEAVRGKFSSNGFTRKITAAMEEAGERCDRALAQIEVMKKK